MMRRSGVKGLLYRHFRRVEKKLYGVSDCIGCMSAANVRYLLAHNPEVSPEKVEISPNSIEVFDKSVSAEIRESVRERYGIPQEKKVFVYGGNLGKPQGIPFILECMKAAKDERDAYFVIVGDGSEYPVIENYIKESGQTNLKLLNKLPKEEYDLLVGACDTGLIFLDHRFTIPNFPSRLLGYLQAKIPVLAATDPNSDINQAIQDGDFGWWCESNDVQAFLALVKKAVASDAKKLGENGFEYLCEHFTVERQYQIIVNQLY